MKYVGVSLAVGLTLLIVIAVGIFSFLPQIQQPPAETVPPPEPVAPLTLDVSQSSTQGVTQPEEDMARREAVYQGQIGQLEQTLQAHQTTYQEQVDLLTGQVATAQAHLDELTAQEEALTGQIAELEGTRTERLALYDSQLTQARRQYEARYAELQAQLEEVLTNLEQANAQLGR